VWCGFRLLCALRWLCGGQGLDLSEQNVVVWSGRRVETYNVTEHGLQTVSAFDLNSQSLALYKTSIYAAAEGALICLNLQGVRTNTIPFTDGEGSAALVDVNGKFLALATSRGMIKIYDVSRTTPKLVCMDVVVFEVLWDAVEG
jgi:hypothetical protein